MDCFISYATPDIEIARQLRDRLMTRGANVFLAEASIPPGSQWMGVIASAVRRCEVAILLDSPSSRASSWVQQEMGMAQASGSLVVPVSLDGALNLLPGWLSGIQAIRAADAATNAITLDAVAAQVCEHLGTSLKLLPPDCHNPRTVGAAVLRLTLVDQFSGPTERLGAWSRQYDRYLRLYYGDRAINPTVSQGASLTFTGIIVERLARYATMLDSPGDAIRAALKRAELFVLGSQDSNQGGFGRLSSDHGARSGRRKQLDLRHTAWAIRALLSIDRDRLHEHITRGLNWLAAHIPHRDKSDCWCWTTAPLLSLMLDERLLEIPAWREAAEHHRAAIESDLMANFDPHIASWVLSEPRDMQTHLSIDNALYVLYCLKELNLAPALWHQCRAAMDALIARTHASAQNGLPLYPDKQAEVGPSAQLIEVAERYASGLNTEPVARFIAEELASLRLMSESFSWHATAALLVPSLSGLPVASALTT